MKAIILGSQSIKLGEADIIVAGGTESMSNTPHYLPVSRKGVKYGDITMIDGIAKDGLTDAYFPFKQRAFLIPLPFRLFWQVLICRYDRQPMGIAAEHIAKVHGFTREQQDDFAVSSYKRAQAAAKNDHFLEIEPIEVATARGKPSSVVKDDEDPKNVPPSQQLNASSCSWHTFS